MHIGQRDIAWYRIGKPAVEKGFTLKDIGKILHAKYHQDFGAIFDKVQVKIYTDKEKVDEMDLRQARKVYQERDARVENMTDETTETYYSCTLCQSFAPNHVCVVSPERTGLCGAYNWMDCKASFEINPTGPNQPVQKGEILDAKLGQWKGVNDFVFKASRQKVDNYNFYSLVYDPMTTCGCCECIAAVLPMCNGIMTVNRDYTGDDPLRDEVHHPGRRHRRRSGHPGLCGPQQVQHHPAEVPHGRRRPEAGGLDAQDPERRTPGPAPQAGRRRGDSRSHRPDRR